MKWQGFIIIFLLSGCASLSEVSRAPLDLGSSSIVSATNEQTVIDAVQQAIVEMGGKVEGKDRSEGTTTILFSLPFGWWSDGELGRVQVSPSEGQSQRVAVLVRHLNKLQLVGKTPEKIEQELLEKIRARLAG